MIVFLQHCQKVQLADRNLVGLADIRAWSTGKDGQ